MENQNDDIDNNEKPKKKFPKGLKILLCILAVIIIGWVGFSFIGRVSAATVIPDSASLRICISNPIGLMDNILSHESLDDIYSVPALSAAVPVIHMLKETNLPVDEPTSKSFSTRRVVPSSAVAE